MEAILRCRGLSHSYGANPALTDVDLGIAAGGIVGLLGPNGSGKTTFIKLAMGMLQPTKGEILVLGKRPSPETKAMTAYLPDAGYLSGWMRVDEQIALFSDFFPDFDAEKARGMLERLGVQGKQRIRALSKGNREKLGLILTMSRAAKLYILDEPIAGVDPAARDFILETVLSNKPQDATILLCTHLIWDVQSILTHAIFLNFGRVVLDSPVKELCEREGKSLNDIFREVFRW